MTVPRLAVTVAVAAGLLAMVFTAGAQTLARKTYIVQLADAPAATYAGNISGLISTRPATGVKFDATAAGVRAYVDYLDIRQASTLAGISNAKVLHRYKLAFNGFAAQLTEAQAKALKNSGDVVSVTVSDARKLDTISTPGFLGIGAPGGLWSRLDGASRNVKGEDVVVGMIDSGVWPEDPSFSDKVDSSGKPVAYQQPGTSVYGPPPVKWHGVCQTGGGFTSAMCNNKLIGARYYVDDFMASGATLAPLEYASPRDGSGHGSHTASTAAGNSNVAATVGGAPVGVMSGMAPRARIAAYKVCWEASVPEVSGCYAADILKAIDDAVADGVDVINFSVSGPQTDFLDPVDIGYFNATAAGIFVAASAGNSGPGNQVAHIGPWLTTVAASTHDRQWIADLALVNAGTYTGASANAAAQPNAPMVLSSDIAAPGVPVADANLCFANSLTSAQAAGKVVVCDRGTNDRLEKSAEVMRAGGVGMVLINPTSANLVADFHSVPTVHLQNTARSAVRGYVAANNALGSIGARYQMPGVIAPVMADFSSRGPNLGNANILKPDLTAPGVDIIAAYLDTSLSQAQHDAVALGNFTPRANAASLQGTSMSSPHVAGAAALLRQLYPSWSPAAIKSALMTSTNDVKLASGAIDPDRWGYGAGHLNPNIAANPGLVYDAGPADHGRFLCGIGLAPPASTGSCATLGAIAPWNLNLASLTASDVPGKLTFTRTVTNVTPATATYISSASLAGWTVAVTPASLTLAPGASATFNVALTRTSASIGAWSFGNLTWSDGVRQVRSPLSARGIGFSAPAQVSDTRVSGSGTKVFTIVSGYTGSLSVAPTGLVPATLRTGSVTAGAGSSVQCFDFNVAPGAQVARFQLFNADTQGGSATDLDLNIYQGPGGTGSLVGASGGTTSDEVVTLAAPQALTYSACVAAYLTPTTGANFRLSHWVVGPASGTQTLRASAPRNVYAGGTASIGLGWAVPAGQRYLGNLQYADNTGAALGSTLVFVDNH